MDPSVPTPTPSPVPTPDQTPLPQDADTTLRLVAFILNIVATVGIGWLIIPLAWMIPMTVTSYGIYKGTKKNTTVFAVCTLIFVSVVAGILLLVSKKDD